MRKLNYEECLNFVRRKHGIPLHEYQRVILKAFCDGEEIFVPRGVGRTTVAKLFGEYVAYVLDKNKKIDDCEQEILTPERKAYENWEEQYRRNCVQEFIAEHMKHFHEGCSTTVRDNFTD